MCTSYTWNTVGHRANTISLSHSGTLELSNFSVLFHGGAYSAATGLYQFRARWYAPELGRWLSPDPIGFEGGLNLYEFCGNNPVNGRDPSGLLWYDDWSDWLWSGAEATKATMNETYPWGVAGGLNTVVDLGVGVLDMPRAIGHLGEGTGKFSACPSWENAGGLVSDIGTLSGVMLGTMGAMPSLRVKAPTTQEPFVPDEYWQKLQKNAPQQSTPYDIKPKYNADGTIKSYTTYDEFGNRAYQYEVDPSVRHGEGYHVYDNSTTAGTGNGPRSPHIPYD